MVDSTISISWEWILGIAFTLILAFLGWILKQVRDQKKEFEQRIRALENENSAKTAQIDFLLSKEYKKFEIKGRKKNV